VFHRIDMSGLGEEGVALLRKAMAIDPVNADIRHAPRRCSRRRRIFAQPHRLQPDPNPEIGCRLGELRKDPEAAPNYVEPNFQITPKNSTLERQNLKFPGSHTANDAAHSSASRHWGGWRRINYWAERSQLESGKGFSGGGSLSKFTEGRQKLRKLPSD
jgi:hypothetical protein